MSSPQPYRPIAANIPITFETADGWTPDAATLEYHRKANNPTSRIPWSSDIAGCDHCSSHDRFFRFLQNDNGKYLKLYFNKCGSSGRMSRSSIYGLAVSYFETKGIKYRSVTDFKNYMASVETRYSRTKATFFTEAGWAIEGTFKALEQNYGKEEVEEVFKDKVENSCPGFWALQEARGDNLKTTPQPNPTDETDIQVTPSNLDRIQVGRGNQDITDVSEEENEEITDPSDHHHASTSESEEEEGEGPQRKKMKTKEQPTYSHNSSLLQNMRQTYQPSTSSERPIRKHMDVMATSSNEEFDLKKRELDLEEKKLRLDAFRTKADKREQRARIRKIKAETKKIKAETRKIEAENKKTKAEAKRVELEIMKLKIEIHDMKRNIRQ